MKNRSRPLGKERHIDSNLRTKLKSNAEIQTSGLISIFYSPQLSKNFRPRDASPLIYLIRIKSPFRYPLFQTLNINIV